MPRYFTSHLDRVTKWCTLDLLVIWDDKKDWFAEHQIVKMQRGVCIASTLMVKLERVREYE